MTRVSTTELTEQLPDILVRVSEHGEQFIIERNGVALAVIQPPTEHHGPTLSQLAASLVGVEWPDPDFFNEIEAARSEMNAPIEPPKWP